MTVNGQNELSYLGVRAKNPPEQIIASRAPVSTAGGDYQYAVGTFWVDQVGLAAYELVKVLGTTGTWVGIGGGASDINTINLNAPIAGNYTLAGTASQITVAETAGTSTFSIPAVAANTTSFTSGSFITSSATQGTTFTANSITPTGSNANIPLLLNAKGTSAVSQARPLVGSDVDIQTSNADNTNALSGAGFNAIVGGASAGDPYINFLVTGAGTYTMGIDNSVTDNFVISASNAIGTSNIASWTSAGALTNTADITAATGNIVASTGNITSTLGSMSAATTVTAGTGITATTGNIVASTGNITSTLGSVAAGTTVTAGTSITATLGAITATNGNLVLGTAGNKILSTSVGTTTAAGANSFGSVTLVGGTATVSTTAVTASSLIVLWRQSIGATGANPIGILYVGTITGGTSFVIHAGTTASATTDVATDVSVVGWMIIN